MCTVHSLKMGMEDYHQKEMSGSLNQMNPMVLIEADLPV